MQIRKLLVTAGFAAIFGGIVTALWLQGTGPSGQATGVEPRPRSSRAERPARDAAPEGFVRDLDTPVVFSDAETFTEPVYAEEDGVSRRPEDEADELSTVVVTRDGRLFRSDVTPDELRGAMETGPPGLVSSAFPGLVEDPRGLEALASRLAEESENGSYDDYDPASGPTRSVIGADSRTRVTDTTSYPFRTFGRIDIGCTGTLIGPRHVLTAGHCVYDTDSDSWYSGLDFSPGQDGSDRPYGEVDWAYAVTVKGWTNKHKREYDYAMIVLDEDVGDDLGWLGFGYDNNLPYYSVNINGYPGDKPFGTLWHAYCDLVEMEKRLLWHDCDTYGGMSGSSAYAYFDSGERIIYGIHAYGTDSTGYNGATRIDKRVFKNLQKWKDKY